MEVGERGRLGRDNVLTRNFGRRAEATVGAIALALIYVFWVGQDLYRQDLLTFGCVFGLVALGMYIPLVLSGSLSVAYNIYFAIGAYAVGMIAGAGVVPLLSSVPAALVVATLVAIAVGTASKGLTGFHLAVATLAVAQASDRFLVQADWVTGGATGLGNIPRVDLLGHQLQRPVLLIAGLVLVWSMAVAVNRLRDSIWGCALRLQRDAPVAAEACGVPTELSRIVGLGIGAAIASLAGVFYALVNQFIIPESFTLAVVFTVIFIPVIGGTRSAWGCVVGAALVMVVNEAGSQFSVSGALVFAVGVLAVLMLAPEGALGLLYALARRIRGAAQTGRNTLHARGGKGIG
jgi:branched-chain amino acid transport system permease protein